jgi:hypothetical protein
MTNLRSSGKREGKSAEKTQAIRVCVANIGLCRDSRSNDRPRSDARPRTDPCPRQDVALALTIAHRKFVISKIRITDLPMLNPWSRILVLPSPDYKPGDEGLLDECRAASEN